MTGNWTAEARYNEPPFLLRLQVTGENPHSQPASYRHSRLLLLLLQQCGYVLWHVHTLLPKYSSFLWLLKIILESLEECFSLSKTQG